LSKFEIIVIFWSFLAYFAAFLMWNYGGKMCHNFHHATSAAW